MADLVLTSLPDGAGTTFILTYCGGEQTAQSGLVPQVSWLEVVGLEPGSNPPCPQSFGPPDTP